MAKKKQTDIKPLLEQSKAYSGAFDYFNNRLFGGRLSPCMLMLTRNKHTTGGYFCPDKWFNDSGDPLPEIAINANNFVAGDLSKLFTILIHEMAHQYQWQFGKPSRSGYHNKEWAKLVKGIGLQPISDDGKETGQNVDTVLIENSKAETAVLEIPDECVFPFYADPLIMGDGDDNPEQDEHVPERKKKSGKRVKYTCAECGLNAWAKADASIICGECSRVMIGNV